MSEEIVHDVIIVGAGLADPGLQWRLQKTA